MYPTEAPRSGERSTRTFCSILTTNARIAQWTERMVANHEVAGSIPAMGTNLSTIARMAESVDAPDRGSGIHDVPVQGPQD